MRVRLTPGSATAGGTKVFEVVAAQWQTTSGELTLTCRDGRVCLGLVGAWDIALDASLRVPMSCDEVEQRHDGRMTVTVG